MRINSGWPDHTPSAVRSLCFAAAVAVAVSTMTGLAGASESLRCTIIQSFAAPAEPCGLGWDGASLWVIGDTSKTLFQLDPTNMAVLSSLPAPVEVPYDLALGLDHDGSDLFMATINMDTIQRVDDQTGECTGYWYPNLEHPRGVVRDDSEDGYWVAAPMYDLWFFSASQGTSRFIPAPGMGFPNDLAWDGSTLWVLDFMNIFEDFTFYRIDPLDGTVLQSCNPMGAEFAFPFGLAHDGEHLWMSDRITGLIHKISVVVETIFNDDFESGDTAAWSATVP